MLTQFIRDAEYVLPFVEQYNTHQKSCVAMLLIGFSLIKYDVESINSYGIATGLF